MFPRPGYPEGSSREGLFSEGLGREERLDACDRARSIVAASLPIEAIRRTEERNRSSPGDRSQVNEKAYVNDSRISKNTGNAEDRRRQLEAIDAEIARLVLARLELLRSEASENGLPARTLRETLASVRQAMAIQFPDASKSLVTSVLLQVAGATYEQAFRACGIAYLGPEHSYSHLATIKYFGSGTHQQGLPSISAVFEEVARDQAAYGVVPIENSTDGRIVDTLTMFAKTPVHISGEVLLPIHHNLLARCQRSEIRTVYSKPQALSQCRAWLTQHLPDARRVEVASTTAAARIAAEESGAAAIASAEAAIEYGLETIAASIEDNPNNVTRFVVISKEAPAPTGNDKTSLMFQVPHKPGALADVMMLFKENGLNLTWIESFPIPTAPNEYLFFVELEGHRDQPSVAKAIASLRLDALRLECLGSYPKASLLEPR